MNGAHFEQPLCDEEVTSSQDANTGVLPSQSSGEAVSGEEHLHLGF
jgi:hypothetical protein